MKRKVDIFRCMDMEDAAIWIEKLGEIIAALKKSKKITNRRGSALSSDSAKLYKKMF